uniref:NADH-ubiquinone oxidoreductase chain 3 n=1 Tax=Thremma gallicum TaxID=1586284 RepID=A0A0U1Z8B6_9NEOP|nr:NADH dehydrogenase subunit 3 [Thremma gallicum]
MYLMMTILLMSLILSNIMIFLALILSKKSFNDLEKSSPFECGFNPLSTPRIPFSLNFFLITIIFLIFDIEISLILPIIMIMNLSNMIIWTLISMLFMIILLLGLYYEWNQNMLNWTL